MDTVDLDVAGMSEDGKKIVRYLTAYFDSLLKSKLDKMDDMKAHIQSLESRIQKLEESADDASAYERRDTLIMSGNVPPVLPGEDCKKIVIDLLKNGCNLIIGPQDISVAHRVGSKPKRQGPDLRKIMFKLVRRDLKTDILGACKSSRPDFFINESLTPIRDKIFFILRKATKKYPRIIHHCKTFDGNVTVFLQSVGPMRGISRLQKVTVNTRRKLTEFLTTKLKSSYEDLEVVWNED